MAQDRPVYEWLVDSRARVQAAMLELYQLVESEAARRTLADEPTARAGFGLLMGAAFSLWRAAFLSDATVTWPENIEHAKKFLEYAIGDNAINYTQDRNTRDWSSGYYLNNARFRLIRAYEKLLQPGGSTPTLVERSLRELDKRGLEAQSRQESWEALWSALAELLPRLRAKIEGGGLTTG